MKNTNMLKKGIATALLATMTVTGVGAFSTDASIKVEANASNSVKYGQEQKYGNNLKGRDEEGENRWNNDFESGYANGRTHGNIYKEDLENGDPENLVLERLKIQIETTTAERTEAFISGYTKGILETFYGYEKGEKIK